MSPLTNLLVSLTVVISSSLGTSGTNTVSKIEWVSVKTSELVLLGLDPAGIEVGTSHFYVCRVKFQGQFVSGKVRINDDNFCYFPNNGTSNRMSDYEVLTSPPSTTSWVPFCKSRTYANAIVTSNQYLDTRLVCRAKYEGSVIPGTLYSDGVCSVEYYGSQIRVDNDDAIEILVLNMYGQRLGVTQASHDSNA